jgi:hypothetical protein
MAPGDDFVDLFPGTGIVKRAWVELSSLSSSATHELSSVDDVDASSLEDVDASSGAGGGATEGGPWV